MVVVGGGIAGLAAAWALRDLDVRVLEMSGRLGGRIRSEPRGDLWLNLGAHVFSGAGSATARLMSEVGIENAPAAGQLVAVELNGRKLVGGRAELYPLRLPLSVSERVALARAGARLRLAVRRYTKVAAARPGETPAQSRRRLLEFGDEQTFADWLGPLPGDAGALFRATVTRSTAEPDEISAGQGIGYFALVWSAGGGLSRNVVGGPGVMIDAIGSALGDAVSTGVEVTRVVPRDGLVEVHVTDTHGQRSLTARHVVVATRAFQTADLVDGLPQDTARALRAIPYGPTVVMGVITGETGPMPWDDVYALATPKRAFTMLFNIGGLAHARSGTRGPGSSLMMYRSAHGALELLDLPEQVIEQRFLDDLYAIYPEARGVVRETQLLKLPRMLPYPVPGRSRTQPAIDRPLGNIHLAGDYLGGSYTDTAISSGYEAAAAIRQAK